MQTCFEDDQNAIVKKRTNALLNLLKLNLIENRNKQYESFFKHLPYFINCVSVQN